MGSTTVHQAFKQFEAEHVRVPDKENAQAKKVHPDFRDAVAGALGNRYQDSFLAGSYRRKTQSEHLKDLDIIIVLNDPDGEYRRSAKGTLEAMSQAATAYDLVAGREVKCRAVECTLTGYPFWVDLVPALETNGVIELAYVNKDTGEDEWREADPRGQTKACSDKNDQTDDIYVPAVRICKFWNQSFTSLPTDKKPLPSYYVEAILADAIDEPVDFPEAVFRFLERALDHLNNPGPSIPCPGAPGTYVDEQLDDDRRQRAAAKVEDALSHARRAMAADDPDEAKDHWARVFGPSFPAPCNNTAGLASAMDRGRATVVGTGASASSSGRVTIPARSHRRG